jgi:hypothetical protein
MQFVTSATKPVATQVSAVIVSEDSKREMQLEHTIMMRDDQCLADGQGQDEELFIAQLHRRARLLNDGFQRRVCAVVESHSSQVDQNDAKPYHAYHFCISDAAQPSLQVDSHPPATATQTQHIQALPNSQSSQVQINHSGPKKVIEACSLTSVPDINQNHDRDAQPIDRRWEDHSSLLVSARQSLEVSMQTCRFTSPCMMPVHCRNSELGLMPANMESSIYPENHVSNRYRRRFSDCPAESTIAGSSESEVISCIFKEGESLVEVCDCYLYPLQFVSFGFLSWFSFCFVSA